MTLIYYSLASDSTDEYRKLVHETVLKAAKVVQTGERKGLDEWINRMYVRVPRELSENASFQALLSISQQQIIKTAELTNADVKPSASGDVVLGIKRFENTVEVGKNVRNAEFQIDVPNVFPVNLIVSDLSNSRKEVCTITETDTVFLDYFEGEKSFTLQTLDGRIYKIPEKDETPTSALKEDPLTRLLNAAVLDKSTKLKLTSENVGRNLTSKDLINLMPQIRQLTNLTTLDLSFNNLTEVRFLRELKNLTELNLNNNRIVDASSLRELNSLTSLNLSDNRISNISFVSELNSLSLLNLSRNQISDASPIKELRSLTALYLANNYITDMSFAGLLLSLKVLDLRGNKALERSIPEEILNNWEEAQRILNYYHNTKESQVTSLNEAKVVVIGEADTGKTSLIRRLIYNDYIDTRSTTGIKIERWENVLINDQNVRLNIWDFGGQEIMHSTHQFFFTQRTIYLLVVNARHNEDHNKIEDWLNRIEILGGDSPVIIVANKIDQNRHSSSDLGYFDINRMELMSKFKNIKGFYGVCSDVRTKSYDDEWEEFKSGLLTEIGKLDGLHEPFPADWFAVKDELESMQEKSIPYISRTEYLRKCFQKNIKEEISQETLLEFLNEIGVIIYFKDLPGRMIFNPEWITNGVYAVTDNPSIINNKGELEFSQLDKILASRGYNAEEHKFILELMKKFELCVEIEKDKRFLIPDLLLSVEEPYTGDWENTLSFEYHYETYLNNIFTKFVVRMYPYIYKKTWWRNGVVLEYEGDKALIKFDASEKKVKIRIKGSNIKKRRDFLAIIRKEFNDIHSMFAALQVEEFVAHPTKKIVDERGREKEILKDYTELLGVFETGKTEIFVKELNEYLPIIDWLDGVGHAEGRLKSRGAASFEKFKPEELQAKLEVPLNLSASENEAQEIAYLRSRNTNFIFLFGKPMSGKTTLIASLIHYLSAVSEYGNLERVGEQKDWRLIENLRYQFGKGEFSNRTVLGSVTEINIRFSPNPQRKRLSDLYLTFLEMSGEDLKEIQTVGEFSDNIDVFFKVENISLTFILMTRFDEAKEDDYLISSFLDYLSAKFSSLRKPKFLLLVSNWDNYSGKDDIREFVSKNMPITFRKISAPVNAIKGFSVGKVSQKEGFPFIERFDVEPTEAVFAWLYKTLTGKDLTSNWEWFRKLIFD